MKFCSYQERCHKEVRTRLYDYGLASVDVEEIIMELIELNYLNEERFAKAYCRGKFKVKNWGREKIKRELKLRDISAYCINKGMEEINEQDYQLTLEKLAEKKLKSIKDTNPFVRKKKLADHLIRKGYESVLVWDWIRNNF